MAKLTGWPHNNAPSPLHVWKEIRTGLSTGSGHTAKCQRCAITLTALQRKADAKEDLSDLFWDWFCEERSLPRRAMELAPKVLKVADALSSLVLPRPWRDNGVHMLKSN